MYTIVNEEGKVLYCRLDLPTVEGEIAISEICTLENSDGKDIFFNFETQQFYLNEN